MYRFIAVVVGVCIILVARIASAAMPELPTLLLATEFEMPWSEVFEKGILGAMACFFVWQTWKREERMSERITALEEFQKAVMLGKLEENTAEFEELRKHIQMLVDRGAKS